MRQKGDSALTASSNVQPAPRPSVASRLAHLSQRLRSEDNIAGWLFALPAVVLIFIFGIFPIGYAAYMSLHRWRIRQGEFLCQANAEAAGSNPILFLRGCLENYEKAVIGDWGGLALFCFGFVLLFIAYRVWTKLAQHDETLAHLAARLAITLTIVAVSFAVIVYGYNTMLGALPRRDQGFLKGLQITFYYAFGSIPIQLVLGLVLAYVLHSKIRGRELYRMIFFLPYVTPTVAAAVVFGIVFSGRDTSLANQIITALGGNVQRWLSEPRPFLNVMFGLNLDGFIAGPSMALMCVILLGIWTYTGYNAVIFMAGLGNIPHDLYEAARVDGASEWHIFRHITLPLLSPVTFYLSLLGFIGTFTAFNTLFVMRTPASQETLNTAALVIFDTFRAQNRWAEATAQAIMLMGIVLVLTLIQRSLFEKRVFYG